MTKIIHDKEGEKEIYTVEDFRRDFGDINTLFNAIEFSQNKIQLSSQLREEKNVLDLINEIIQLRESLSQKEKETPIDWGSLTNLLIQILRALSSAISSNPQAVAQAAEKLRDVVNTLTGRS
jgi:predicted transcriptional regulator